MSGIIFPDDSDHRFSITAPLNLYKMKEMEKIYNLKDLLVEQLGDLQSSEKLQLDCLKTLKVTVHSNELRIFIEQIISTTEMQVERLMQVINELKSANFGRKSMAMGSIICEGLETLDRTMDPEVRDAAIINYLQSMKHFEIAGYGTASAYANELQLKAIAGLLHKSLEEEKQADSRLTKLAIKSINEKAISPIAG